MSGEDGSPFPHMLRTTTTCKRANTHALPNPSSHPLPQGVIEGLERMRSAGGYHSFMTIGMEENSPFVGINNPRRAARQTVNLCMSCVCIFVSSLNSCTNPLLPNPSPVLRTMGLGRYANAGEPQPRQGGGGKRSRKKRR